MGGADVGGGGPHGGGGGSQLRADVWRGASTGEDRSAGRGGAGGGESPGLVSGDASAVGRPADGAADPTEPPAAGGDADRDDLAAARPVTAGGLSVAVWERGAGAGAAGAAHAPGGPGADPRAVAAGDRDGDPRAGGDRHALGPVRGGRSGGHAAADGARRGAGGRADVSRDPR